ncbi:MAG: hypothetical protein O7A09_05230 [Proteobacteria bacterium]|nr:hypothetical protein [Pseudomonadota bacterium]
MAEARPEAATSTAADLPGPPLTPPLTDWTLRPFEAVSVSPLWVGAALALGFWTLCAGVRLTIGGGEFGTRGEALVRNPYFWMDLLNGVLFAYVPSAVFVLRRGALRDLRDLRPSLAVADDRFRKLAEETVCVAPHRLALAGAGFGIALGLLPVYDPNIWGTGERPDLLDPFMIFMIARHAALGWLLGHAVITEVHLATSYARLGADHVRVDLLDQRPLRPFARRGLRSAFAWILYSSLISLFWLGPAPGSSNAAILAGLFLVLILGFLLGVSGVRDSIHRAKREKLDGLRDAIRRESERVLDAPAPGEPGSARLASLIAYQGLVERVREWPFDAPVLLRLAVYALLGVLSWLGGALVERLLDDALR